MPYKFEKEKLKINEKDKRNIKLSAEEKLEIKKYMNQDYILKGN